MKRKNKENIIFKAIERSFVEKPDFYRNFNGIHLKKKTRIFLSKLNVLIAGTIYFDANFRTFCKVIMLGTLKLESI